MWSTRDAGLLVPVAWSKLRAIRMGMLASTCLQPAHVQASDALVLVLVVAPLPIELEANPLTRSSLRCAALG